MAGLTPTNTRWRDSYGRAWRWSLALAVALHAGLFLFLPRGIADRLHEALIPSPTVFFVAGGPGAELEVVRTRSPADEPAETEPEPAPEEEVAEIEEVEDVAEEITLAEVAAAPSPTAGVAEGTPEGSGEAVPAPGGGGGMLSPPRPLHLVVPEIPSGLDKRRARGAAVHLLVEVLPDGSVGEVVIEKGSRFAALDTAAMTAARQMRYLPARRGDAGITQWTRAEMRF